MPQKKYIYIQPTGNFKLPLKFYWQFPKNKKTTQHLCDILTFYGFIYDMPEIKPSKGLSTAPACLLQNIIQRNRCLKSSCRSFMSRGMRFEQCYTNTCPFQDRLDPPGHSLCSHRIMWLNGRNNKTLSCRSSLVLSIYSSKHKRGQTSSSGVYPGIITGGTG